jgi:hypothetical protein
VRFVAFLHPSPRARARHDQSSTHKHSIKNNNSTIDHGEERCPIAVNQQPAAPLNTRAASLLSDTSAHLKSRRLPSFLPLNPPPGKKSRRGGTLDEIAEQLQLAKKGSGGGNGEWRCGVSAMDDGDGDGPSTSAAAAAAAAAADADMEMAEAVGAALKARNSSSANNNKTAKRKQKRQERGRVRVGGPLGVPRLGAGGTGGGAMDTGEAATALTMTWSSAKGGVGKRTGKRGKHTARQARRAAMAAERGTAAAERRVKRHVQTIAKKSARGHAKSLY